jgi:pantetheine-phosphate adenylyltransferase
LRFEIAQGGRGGLSVKRRAIYPGSFDPVTNGHLDIIERACHLFDEVVVAILINPNKAPLFTVEERVEMLGDVLNSHFPQVRVDTFTGLLVEYAVGQQAQAVVRGIRAISDYEYELQMALMNRRLAPSVETIFLMAPQEYSFISSRLVKEVFTLGGSVEGFVPPLVIERMKAKTGGSSPK